MSECEVLVRKLFPKGKYEIKRVSEVGGKCVVDFKRKEYEPEMSCEEYCTYVTEGTENYDRCVAECEESLEHMLIGSIMFDKETLSVEDATIPGTCRYVWYSGSEPYEEWEKESKEIVKKFKNIGCSVEESWIHPHELVSSRKYEEEPAICYYHPFAKHKGKCKVTSVLRIVDKEL